LAAAAITQSRPILAALKQRQQRARPAGAAPSDRLKRTYPSSPFIRRHEQALQYRACFDLGRLEALILKRWPATSLRWTPGRMDDA